MKKRVAKILIWMINRLGYHQDFGKKYSMTIDLNSSEAERKLKKLTEQAEALNEHLIKINDKLVIKGSNLRL